jgi:PAS domain S-box-containing protein
MADTRLRGGSGKAVDESARTLLSPEGERIAQLFEHAPSFVAFLRGPTHVYEWVNRTHYRVAAGREVIGRSVAEAMPELAEQGIVARLDAAYKSGEAIRASELELYVLSPSGQKIEGYFDFVCQPIRGGDGAVLGVLVEGQDVTGRVTAYRALQAREERLRLALDAGRMATYARVPSGDVVESSPELNALLGLPAHASLTVAEFDALLAPGESERILKLVEEAHVRGEPFFEAEMRCRPVGSQTYRHFLVRGRTSSSDTEAGPRQFAVMMDVTERKQAEERLLLLASEVDHRANNLLAAVQSLVALTRATDVAAFREALLGRVTALAQAHRLLAESRWTGASLRRVVDEEVRAFAATERVQLTGPDASLAPPVAQGLAVALHELATNALRHGAWSQPDGRVVVTWTSPDKDRFVGMTWQETGGPPAREPERSGLGLSLLRRALTGPINGAIELEWLPRGLRCWLRFPVL